LKEGEIINENKTLLPIPGSDVYPAGIGGKEKDGKRRFHYF
jgi:hypothetical protein